MSNCSPPCTRGFQNRNSPVCNSNEANLKAQISTLQKKNEQLKKVIKMNLSKNQLQTTKEDNNNVIKSLENYPFMNKHVLSLSSKRYDKSIRSDYILMSLIGKSMWGFFVEKWDFQVIKQLKDGQKKNFLV